MNDRVTTRWCALACALALAAGCGGGTSPGTDANVGDAPSDLLPADNGPGDDGPSNDRPFVDPGPVDVPAEVPADVPPPDVPKDVPPADVAKDVPPTDVPPADVPCAPGACDDGNPCTIDQCAPATGECSHPAASDGIACDDGDPGTVGDNCRNTVCIGLPVGATPCRVTAFTLESPEVRFGFPGDTPEVINGIIGAYLTAELQRMEQGGVVGLFEPLVVGAKQAGLRFGEALCVDLAGGQTECNLLPGGHEAGFDAVAYGTDGTCGLEPAAAAPCFGTDPASFALSSLLPAVFPAGLDPVVGNVAGSFDAFPPTAIPAARVAAFVPKAVGVAAVGTRTVNLGGQDVALATLLDTVPTVVRDGVEGWAIVVGFTARCVPLLNLATDCNGVPGRCDDGLSCTTDRCVSWTECAHDLVPGTCLVDGACFAEGQPDPAGPCRTCQSILAPDRFLADDRPACDDGDPCTTGDRCREGACAADPVACDDGLPCTTDLCQGGTCRHEPFEGPCNDGDLCTRGDTCQAGACTGTAVTCQDDNACTDDSCDSAVGCVFAPNADPCDDGNACTVGDRCAAGACKPGAAGPDCDDHNPCTDDGCVPSKGCVHIPNADPCDDGNACTVGDTCDAGTCAAGTAALACDDSNPCTDDGCDPATGCTNAANTLPCTDGNACTVGDRCADKACVPGATPLACNDGNGCTDDRCDPATGCVSTPNSDPCDDGDPCLYGDTCRDGFCVPGTLVLACDDGNPCTDESCVARVGCVSVNNTVPCDDGDPCWSNDVCGGGTCLPGAVALECDDGNGCTADACVTGLGCTNLPTTDPCDDHTVCTVNDTCSNTQCVGTPIVCDDGNDCTIDTCDPVLGCQFAPDLLNSACRPEILFDFPPRAVTLDGSRDIEIRGHVVKKGAPIDTFVIGFNGTDVPVAVDPTTGAFSLPVTSNQGVNIIVSDAVDGLGFKDHGVRTYAYSTKWYPIDQLVPDASRVPDGIGLNLGAAVWDDQDRSDTDSIADVLVAYVKGIDLSAMVGGAPITGACQVGCNYKITITSVTFDRNNVGLTIVPVNGGLQLEATLNSVVANFHADMSNGSCFPWVCALGDFDGTITVAWVKAVTTVLISVDAVTGEPVVTNGGTTVTMADPQLSTSNWLVNLLKGLFISSLKQALVDAFQGAIGDLIGGTLADALKMLNINQVITIGPLLTGGSAVDVTLDAKLGSIFFDTSGGVVGLKTTATAPHVTTHTPLGSIGRASCLSGTPEPFALPRTYPLEMGLHDDVINQLVFGIFWGGGLAFPLGQDTVGDLSAYGVTDLNLYVDFLLAPMLTACNPEAALKAQLGDISVSGSLKLFGTTVSLQMYASALADASVGATSGELSVSIGQLTFADLEIESLTGGLAGGEDILMNLVKQTLLPQLLGSFAGQTLGSFPIPSIPLDGIDPSIPPGTAIAIDLQQVTRVYGYTVAQGVVKQ